MDFERRGLYEHEGKTYWTGGAVARECGISAATWYMWTGKGWITKPETKIGKRIYYRESQLPALRREVEHVLDRREAKRTGWSVKTLAAELGIANSYMQYYLKMRQLPSPKQGDRYTREEARNVKEAYDYMQRIRKTYQQFTPGLVDMGCTPSEQNWAEQHKAELIEGIASIRLSDSRVDVWYTREALVTIIERLRLRRSQRKAAKCS